MFTDTFWIPASAGMTGRDIFKGLAASMPGQNERKNPLEVMIKGGYEKTEEELLKERAEVLGKTGAVLSEVLEKLHRLDRSIREKMAVHISENREPGNGTRPCLTEINEEIRTFNSTRKQAQLRYYYLIVTREALGLRKHRWVEEIYHIPPVKRPFAPSGAKKPEGSVVDG